MEPTITEIKEILGLDYQKSILFLKGMFLNEDNVDDIENDFAKALMIEPEMIIRALHTRDFSRELNAHTR